MNWSIISMFEDRKRETFTNIDDYLSKSEQERIIAWFSQYTLKKDINVDVNTVIDLMYELYIRENIDFYPVDEYQRVTTVLAEKYHINRTQFLEMLQSFRLLVYGRS